MILNLFKEIGDIMKMYIMKDGYLIYYIFLVYFFMFII